MSAVQQQMQQISAQENVIGVVIADVNGLCMGASGSLLPASSAHVQSLLDVASKLSEDGERPVVSIQTSSSDILISHTDGYTTAIARLSNFSRESFQPQQPELQQPQEDEQQQQQQQQQQQEQ